MTIIIQSQEALADLFGVSRITVQDWQSRPGFPIRKTGAAFDAYEYDTAAVIAWYIAWKASERPESPADRLTRARAEMLELDLRKRRGELAPAAEVARLLSAAVVNAREFLRGESPRLAMLLDGLDRPGREALLAKTFDEFLNRLAAWRPASDAGSTTTAAPHERNHDEH